MFHHSIGRVAGALASGVAVIGLVAGCASGTSGSVPTSAPSAGAGALVLPTVPPGPVVVAATTGPLGVYLVDGAGRTLYLFDADSDGTSSCVDACATSWPPLTATGSPTADAGAAADKLGTKARADGALQVQYAGHPLYFFAGDQTAGQTSGEGSDGKWWIVGPDGSPIRTDSSGQENGDTDNMPGGGY
jgi:predicted lipoprotein with Yx(FWY)xxD motif